jgi:glycerol-3-phosphate dehydrogenase
MYDLLAGKENMESSYLMSKGKALETFPMLKSDGLVGAVVYYDGVFHFLPIRICFKGRWIGQHNDSRMNIALIMSAVKHGAIVANHCEVTTLHKNSGGVLDGARVRDNLTGKEWNVRAKVWHLSQVFHNSGLTSRVGYHKCHRAFLRHPSDPR